VKGFLADKKREVLRCGLVLKIKIFWYSYLKKLL